jgi:hypothetical protein
MEGIASAPAIARQQACACLFGSKLRTSVVCSASRLILNIRRNVAPLLHCRSLYYGAWSHGDCDVVDGDDGAHRRITGA